MPITTCCTCGQSITGICHPDVEGCKQLFLTNADNHYKMEEKNYPSSEYQPLFDYLTKEHGLTLLQGQMNDLIEVVHKFHPAGSTLPANDSVQNWFEENIDKECSASSAVYKFRQWLESLQLTRQAGAMWVKADTKPEHNVGVLVFIPGEDNHITSGMWDISNKWVLLDEYRTPEEEVTHWMPLPAFPEGHKHDVFSDEWVSTLKAIAKEELSKRASPAAAREEDAVEFAEWAATIAFFDDGTRLWELMGEGEAINGQFRFTTKEFYQVFKQKTP